MILHELSCCHLKELKVRAELLSSFFYAIDTDLTLSLNINYRVAFKCAPLS